MTTNGKGNALAAQLRGMTDDELEQWLRAPRAFDPEVNSAAIILAETNRRSQQRATNVNGPKAAELLRQAAANLSSALALLDTSERSCGACGRPHWRDKVQAKIFQTWTRTPASLIEAAKKLEAEAEAVNATNN